MKKMFFLTLLSVCLLGGVAFAQQQPASQGANACPCREACPNKGICPNKGNCPANGKGVCQYKQGQRMNNAQPGFCMRKRQQMQPAQQPVQQAPPAQPATPATTPGKS